jgi:hypothetical protein
MRERAIVVIAGLLFATPAAADRATADQLAADAETLAKAGNLADAAAKFLAAYAADPRPELACDVGVAYYKLAQLPRAERYLKTCVDTGKGLEPAFLERVRGVLTSVEAALVTQDVTPVDLVLEPQAAVGTIDLWPDEPIANASRVWLAFGHYRLSVRAPGYIEKTVEFDASSHAPSVQRVTLTALPPAPGVPGLVTRAPPPSDKLANELLIGAGAAAVVGIGFHLGALHVRGELADAQTGTEWDQHNGSFEALRDLTVLCYALAVGAGAYGGYLRYRNMHARDTGPAVGAALVPGGAAVQIEWRR